MLKCLCLHILNLTSTPTVKSSMEIRVETKIAAQSEVRQCIKVFN